MQTSHTPPSTEFDCCTRCRRRSAALTKSRPFETTKKPFAEIPGFPTALHSATCESELGGSKALALCDSIRSAHVIPTFFTSTENQEAAGRFSRIGPEPIRCVQMEKQ